MSEKPKERFWRLSNPLAWGGCITVVFVFVIFALSMSQYCEINQDSIKKCSRKFSKFLNSSPNEIGDTLAGIAGSLAFLWIIITVWIQAQALKAQKDVLSLQAEELGAQKDVLSIQAEELKAQREVLTAQKEELKLSREESSKMNVTMSSQLFENTFFSILTMHNDIVNGIDLTAANKDKITGRDCFRTFFNAFRRVYKVNGDPERSYSSFWKTYQQDLGHYFRFLYRSFKFISDNPNSQEYHGKMLRSQLSDYELLMLFYNCQSEYGRNFRQYALEFQLFDNLPLDRLVNAEDYDLIDQAAFGANTQ